MPFWQPRPSGQADRANDNPNDNDDDANDNDDDANDNDRSRGTDLAALGGAQDILIDPTFKEAGMAPHSKSQEMQTCTLSCLEPVRGDTVHV